MYIYLQKFLSHEEIFTISGTDIGCLNLFEPPVKHYDDHDNDCDNYETHVIVTATVTKDL